MPSKGLEDKRFEKLLGYEFSNPSLLELALTHRSNGPPNNERLEFLGDAVLGYVVGDLLYKQKPTAQEDALTLMRVSLVRRETLAGIARELNMGDHLRLGASAASSGGHRRDSILADALEAVIGAVHCDGGIDASRGLVERLWSKAIAAADPEGLKDTKTRLQEWLQARGLLLPEYVVAATEGLEHKKSYEVHCRISGQEQPSVGVATSRRGAEKAAAEAMLERLQ